MKIRGIITNRIVLLLIVGLLCLLMGCSSKGSDSGIIVYDFSMDRNCIIPNEYEPDCQVEASGVEACVDEYIDRMVKGPEKSECMGILSHAKGNVTAKYDADNSEVVVDLSDGFEDLSTLQRTLVNAAMVKTLCQIPGVEKISVTSNGNPVLDQNGMAVAAMGPEQFYFSEDTKDESDASVSVYFADETGDKLVLSSTSVKGDRNKSMEQLVLERIIAGPVTEGAYPTLNSKVKINDVSTVNGICYVNLSSAFLSKTTNVSNEVYIYSIVNSLTEIPRVNRVRFIIDDQFDATVGDYSLSKLFERNLDL